MKEIVIVGMMEVLSSTLLLLLFFKVMTARIIRMPMNAEKQQHL